MSAPKISALAAKVLKDLLKAKHGGGDRSEVFRILDEVIHNPEAQTILGTLETQTKKVKQCLKQCLEVKGSLSPNQKKLKREVDGILDDMKAWATKKFQEAMKLKMEIQNVWVKAFMDMCASNAKSGEGTQHIILSAFGHCQKHYHEGTHHHLEGASVRSA